MKYKLETQSQQFMKKFRIESIKSENQDWINELLQKEWFSTKVVSRGKLHDASKLPGFIAYQAATELIRDVKNVAVEFEIILSENEHQKD